MSVKVTRCSELSGKPHEMELPTTMEKATQWLTTPRHQLPLIQDFFPELNDEQREFMLTGITPEEWAALGEDE